jgi:pyridinium-3,5-biscarboxylic acid mononucleotide synthase
MPPSPLPSPTPPPSSGQGAKSDPHPGRSSPPGGPLPSDPSAAPPAVSWQDLLESFQSGQVSPERFAEAVLAGGRQPTGGLCLDADRHRRCGYGEVIYGQGKPVELLHRAIEQSLELGLPEVLITRVTPLQAEQIVGQYPHVRWALDARTLRVSRQPIPAPDEVPSPTGYRPVAVMSAGSTDAAVAEEARETLAWMQVPTRLIQDVGVAGPYRLFPHLNYLRQAAAVVVVAGMEGALASVIGGQVGVPVVAVPTSVGYGANMFGLTPLLGMLSSCPPNVSVVNIDAGFKGGYVAGLIARQQPLSPSPTLP